jgi:hypothetical protein
MFPLFIALVLSGPCDATGTYVGSTFIDYSMVPDNLNFPKPAFHFGFWVKETGNYYIWSWTWVGDNKKMKSWIKVNNVERQRSTQESKAVEDGPFWLEANRVYPIEFYLEKDGDKRSQLDMKWKGPDQAEFTHFSGERLRQCKLSGPICFPDSPPRWSADCALITTPSAAFKGSRAVAATPGLGASAKSTQALQCAPRGNGAVRHRVLRRPGRGKRPG